jgi:hypothetical protein
MNVHSAKLIVRSTVKIDCTLENGTVCSGPGFFFTFLKTDDNYVPAIITNKHVIEGAVTGCIYFTVSDDTVMPNGCRYEKVILDQFEKRWLQHPEESIDLCIMPIADIMKNFHNKGIKIAIALIETSLIPSSQALSELLEIEDVTMVGYPIGLWDEINNYPIVRRGITATPPFLNFCGNEEFLIDAACFPGSSGSPVFLYNEGGYTTKTGTFVVAGGRLLLLGVLYGGAWYNENEGKIKTANLPRMKKALTVTEIPNNLGVVIKSNKINDFEVMLKEYLKSQ